MAVSQTKKKTVRKKPSKRERLTEKLLLQRPQAKAQLDRLAAHYDSKLGYGVFAPISNSRCPACNLTIAAARLLRAKSGEFIDCNACGRFLYFDEE